jgi:ABC-type transport system involved in multi-copper enzyme maturation permease subunit
MDSFFSSAAGCTILGLIVVVTALPWLALIEPEGFKLAAKKPLNWAYGIIAILVLGAVFAMFAGVVLDAGRLMDWGRIVGALIHLQMIVGFFAVLFPIILLIWPHGGAVALAAFLEGIRQPMFWMMTLVAAALMYVSIVIPYFTFGEDAKMVKELGFDTIMIVSVIFSVLAASMSISEEIEGRTAITVMSKPVSRRQFLLGKFLGILLAAVLMTMLLGWVFNGVLYFKPLFDKEPPPDPFWIGLLQARFGATVGAPTVNFLSGSLLWLQMIVETLPGLIFGLCKTMVLLSIAVALSTRLPLIVNLISCLVIFFLGHLTHSLVQVSENKYKLVNFVAKTFETILPGLNNFDLSALIAKDTPTDMSHLWIYVGSVFFYAFVYSTIALVFGLILFEDRDLA